MCSGTESPSHSMPPRLTKESYRPRVTANRTVVGNPPPICLQAPGIQRRRRHGCMRQGRGYVRRRTANETYSKRMARLQTGAGCHEISSGPVDGEKCLLTSPFYSTFAPARRLDVRMEESWPQFKGRIDGWWNGSISTLWRFSVSTRHSGPQPTSGSLAVSQTPTGNLCP